MLKKPLVVLVFVLLLSASPVYVSAGFSWENSCLNSSYLLKEATFFVEGTEYSINQTVYCPYGCYDHVDEYGAGCNPTRYNQNLMFAGIVFFLLFVIYLAWRSKK